MKRILGTLAFIVALAGASVLIAGSSQKAGSSADPACCESHKNAAASCAKNDQVASVSSAPSCSTA